MGIMLYPGLPMLQGSQMQDDGSSHRDTHRSRSITFASQYVCIGLVFGSR